MSNLTTLTIVVLLVWHFPNISISDKERLLEYFMDGLPPDNGAYFGQLLETLHTECLFPFELVTS